MSTVAQSQQRSGSGAAGGGGADANGVLARAEGELRPPSDLLGVHRAFEQQLRLQPQLADRIFGDGRYEESDETADAGGVAHVDVNAELVNRASYRQLNAVANLLARLLKQHLSQLDDQPDCGTNSESQQVSSLVVVCMNPRLERVLAVLALWKLGLAFIPLDRTVGTERVAAILEEARPIAALAMPESRGILLDAAARLTFRLNILVLTNVLPSDCFFERDYRESPQAALRPSQVAAPQEDSEPRPVRSAMLATIGSFFNGLRILAKLFNRSSPPDKKDEPVVGMYKYPARTSMSWNDSSRVPRDSLEDAANASTRLQIGTQRLHFVDFEKASSVRCLSSHGFPLYAENLRENEMFMRKASPPAGPKRSRSELNARTLAVVIYTSGSTGKPKGARITQANLLARLDWQWACVPFGERDVALHKTSSTFLDSVSETFSAIGRLVPLVIAPHKIASPATFEQFANIIQRFRVTRLVMVPSPWQSFCNHLLKTSCAPLGSVSTVILSGEALHAAVVNLTFTVWESSSLEAAPTCAGTSVKCSAEPRQVLNFYGSSETTGDVTYEAFERKIADPNIDIVSIGRPMWNTCAYIVDESGELVNEDVEGELYIAGAHVSDGYVVEPVETASSPNVNAVSSRTSATASVTESAMSVSIESPFSENTFDADERLRHMYRMGDLGVMHNGRVTLKGRAGAQVKLLGGHRLHLSEVECAVVQAFANFGVEIEKALALLVEHSPSHRRQHTSANVELSERVQVIVVFYNVLTHLEIHDAVGEEKLLEAIYTHVKMPRVSFAFHRLEQFPTQSHSGKVDRLKLRLEAKHFVREMFNKQLLNERLRRLPEGVERSVYRALYEATDTLLELRGDMELNYIGLDSLRTVNFVGIAEELGIHIAELPEQVAPGRQLKTIHDLTEYCRLHYAPGAISSAPALETKFPSWARLEMLQDAQHEEVARVFGPAFARGIEVHAYLKLSEAELVEFNGRMFWPHFLTSGCSFIVRDTRQPTAPIVAVMLALDAEHFEEYVAAHAEEMQDYLSGVRYELRALGHMFEHADRTWERFNEAEREKRGSAWPAPTADRPHRGHWLDINAVCVEFAWMTDAAHTLDRAQLSLALEPHCHQLARQHKYIGVKTINMEDSTRSLSKQFGLTVLLELDLHGTECEGRTPFEKLSRDCKVNLAYKYL